MDKKIIISILAVFLLVIAGFLFYSNRKSDQNAIYEMEGLITEAKEGVIVIEGLVGAETKSIEFIITDKTVLQKNATVITLDQIKSGKEFTPQIEIRSGGFNELARDVRVLRVTANKDLLTSNIVTALEINYLTYDLPALE